MRKVGPVRSATVGAAGILLAAALIGSAATANTGAHGDDWQVLTFPGIDPSQFVLGSDGRIDVLAENSSALLYRMVTPAEGEQPFLRWRWRVDRTMPSTDLSRKGADDRPLAVHLWFPVPEERLSFWDRMTDALRADLLDAPLTGYVLTYVWGGKRTRGQKMLNPYIGDRGVMIILRDGGTPTGRWFDEKIDYARDFEMAFGFRPPSPSHIALSGDADDTWSRSAGTVARLAFAGD